MKNYFREILILLGPDISRLPGLLLLFLAVSVLDLVGIVLIGPYVAIIADPSLANDVLDRINIWVDLQLPSESLLILLSLLLVMVFLVKAIAAIWINYVIHRFSFNQQVRLRSELMRAYQSLPYEVYLQRNSAEYIYCLQTLVGQYSTGIVLGGMKSLSESVIALAIILLLAWISPLALALLAALSIIVIFSYERFFRKNINKIGKQANDSAKIMLQGAHEGIEGLKEIRILGNDKFFYNKVYQGAKTYGSCQVRSSVISAAPRYLLEFVMMGFVVSLVILTLTFNQDQQYLLPILSMFGMAAVRLLPAINLISSSLIKFRFYRDGVSRLYNDVMNIQRMSPTVANSAVKPSEKFKLLSMNKVVYRYPAMERDTLSQLTLNISAGESVGLIGPSGSGKTTLVDVMLGLLSPQFGEVLFNDRPLKNCLDEWHRHVAYIPQQVFISDDKFRNNVALGVDENEIDEEKVMKALEMAKLSELVQQLPNGLETMLGERGMRLSGGQRQRVALARAFYYARDVLIMDEATSALDNEMEQEIVEEIGRLKGKITLIVIAHRLSTVSKCDKIYKIEEGVAVSSGTPSEMLV